jgi:putative Mn2+ efflux pump MntP
MKNFLVGLIKDIIDQAWTLLGMAVAWLVLEGSAKDLTGTLIMITLGVWVITFPLRYEKPEEEEKPVSKKIKKS